MPEDLDLRLVRYFTAVAEHRHFGRAAEALRIGQPSLSRQIRRLEQQVGVRLFDRTPKGTSLTEAGEVFLPSARALLRSAEEATARSRAAGQPRRITVGYTGNLVITAALREVRRRNPGADVRARHLHWDEARQALLTYQVDAVVARAPMDGEGLSVTVLYEEPRVVVLPVGHRLAGKESVSIEDIADEPVPRGGGDPLADAFWRIDPRPDGAPAPDGPVVRTIEDKLEAVASGQAVAIVSALPGTPSPRADVTAVPLRDAEPGQVVLVTRAGDKRDLVVEFSNSARELLSGKD